MKRVAAAALWPRLRTLQIYGANTGVGKTIFSTVLCRAFQRKLQRVQYVKPVSTGPLDEADDSHISRFAQGIKSKTLYQFAEPVSPHIAARGSSQAVSDNDISLALYDELHRHATGADGIAIVETAGGVLSPAPSGSTQADVYRPLRLPTFLVGDHRLGGIGSTISAWESLYIRGYNVQSVSLFAENRYENAAYLKDYFAERDISSFSIPPPPDPLADAGEDHKAMLAYYEDSSINNEIDAFVDTFLESHDKRISDLRNMPKQATEAIWHPFMQHSERNENNIVAMESAYGDYFQTYTKQNDTVASSTSDASPEPALLQPAFDASASWWTQGLGHGNPQLALTAAHAAGKYGHVMFAGAVHEPALTLAQTLVQRMGNPRLSKVFYTDNGSTGMEVAVKMALRAASKRHGWKPEDGVEILGLIGSYHGDTMGTMDCSEPSIFNKKVEWYQGRGHWLDFPQVRLRDGQWEIDVPKSLHKALGKKTRTFGSLEEIFDLEARRADWGRYRSYLDAELWHLRQQGHKFGALIMEPVILGAGGMLFADPLFQRCLVDAVRGIDPNMDNARAMDAQGKDKEWQGMPVIFDEVFTGLYRLGRFDAAGFLGTDPDIVVNAKLLTGGLLPLCTTTASEAVFEAFLSGDKSDALLHGHSYTAHAIGCSVANESLSTMATISQGEDWAGFRKDWKADGGSDASTSNSGATSGTPVPWSMWSNSFVSTVSQKPNVDYVFAIGSVFAMSLKDPAGSGYASTAATGLRDRLFAGSQAGEPVIHSRVLGNVLYLMGAMTSTPETLKGVEETVLRALDG